MYQKILNISVIVLTIILWSLQMIPQDSNNHWILFVDQYVLNIATFSSSFVVLLHVIDLFFQNSNNDKNKKRWLKKFLNHIIDEHLGGNVYSTRISILRKQSGFIVFFKSFWYYIIINFINNFKNGCWVESIKKIAIHLCSGYLTVYVRYSYPKTNLGCTYFRLSDKANQNKFNGIADKCFVEGLPVNVITPYIGDIKIESKMENYTPSKKNRIKKYMKDSYIDKSFYDTLKSMRKISNNLYAVPVALDDQSIWGVVIIDSDRREEIDYEKLLDEYMASYMKIINFSLSALK